MVCDTGATKWVRAEARRAITPLAGQPRRTFPTQSKARQARYGVGIVDTLSLYYHVLRSVYRDRDMTASIYYGG